MHGSFSEEIEPMFQFLKACHFRPLRAQQKKMRGTAQFFRPWTLDGHSIDVPHITRLGLILECPQDYPQATGPDTKADCPLATRPDAEIRLIDVAPLVACP